MLVSCPTIRPKPLIVVLLYENNANNNKNAAPDNHDRQPATMQLFPEQQFKKQNSEPNGKYRQ